MSLSLGIGLGLTMQSPNWWDAYRAGGVSPALILNFKTNQYFNVLQKDLSTLTTFTRASSGTYIGSDGLLKTAATDEERITYDPSTLASRGYLAEKAATNQLLNSDTLSTQNVTVAAVEQTLHFTGTGTITLTGVSTAGPLVGTGSGESNRVSLTFTPTAGTLTCTVSGTVTNAQLETGGVVTSYIPSTGVAGTRAIDRMAIDSGSEPFVGFDGTKGTWVLKANWVHEGLELNLLSNPNNDRIIYQNNSGTTLVASFDGAAFISKSSVFTDNVDICVVQSYLSGGDFNILADGSTEGSSSLTGDFSSALVDIGQKGGAGGINGVIYEIIWYPEQLDLATRQGFSV